MKRFRRALALCLVFCVLLSFVGCDASFVLNGLFGNEDENFEPCVIEEVTKDAFENSYRDQLNANEMAIYDAVANAALGENVFEITLPSSPELCKGRAPTEEERAATLERVGFWAVNALYAVWLDCPRLFWLETGNFQYTYTIDMDDDRVVRAKTVTLTLEKRENASFAAKAQAEIDMLLAGLSFRGGDDAERVRAINDYLCGLIAYEYSDNQQNVFGALIENECVCEGYSHAFKLLCDKYGIACVSIVGTGHSNGGSEAHMWNAVRIDGEWYGVDVTWNDQEAWDAKNAFLLVGADTESFGWTFADSHVATYTRGTSKVFASPLLSKEAYEWQNVNNNLQKDRNTKYRG